MLLPHRCKAADVNNKKPLRASESAARASFPLSLCGSMTLEAAAAVPLFLFFVMNLLFIFEEIRLQSGLQAALQQAGEQVCEAAYYTRFGPQGEEGGEQDPAGSGAVSFLLSETYVRNKVVSYLGESFWKHSCVVGGKAGLSFAGSKILSEGDRVEIIVNCRVRPFVRMIAFPDFTAQARYCGHAWVGWTEGSGAAETGGDDGGNPVYVTKWGEVYHTDPHCMYLNPQIRQIPASDADRYRSGDGSRYYPCECCRPGRTGPVYITKEGNRYHGDPDCSGIARYISEMEESAARGHYRPCSKCGGQHK